MPQLPTIEKKKLHNVIRAMSAEQRPIAPIQTYVMMDFETTGLFPGDSLNPMNDFPLPGDPNRNPCQQLTNYIRMTNSRSSPQIVEMSAVSTSRSQIRAGIAEMNALSALEDQNDDTTDKPLQFVIRVPCNVHTRQVKPNLTEKEWSEYESKRNQSQAIKFTRIALEERNNFAVEWTGMQLFLEQLPKPACIIAHNGVRFDFRVLYAELERHNLLRSKPIPEQKIPTLTVSFALFDMMLLKVYFVDSYLMFMDLEKKHHEDLRLLTQFIDWSKLNKKLCRPPKLHIMVNNNTNTPMEASIGEQKRQETEVGETRDETSGAASSSCALDAIEENTRAAQFSTPPKRALEPCTSSSSPRSAKRRLFDIAYDHPLQFVRTSQWSPAKKKRVRSNFFQRLNDGDWVFDGHVSMKYFREKGVFKLERMYRELINGQFEAHFAQDDCEALLQICMAYGQEFIDYVDAKAAPFPYHLIANNTVTLS